MTVSIGLPGEIRARYRFAPAALADQLAEQVCTAMPGGPAWARGRVVSVTPAEASHLHPWQAGAEAAGSQAVEAEAAASQGAGAEDVATVEIVVPSALYGRNLTTLAAALVAGEAHERSDFTWCRLVNLALPPSWLPGPRLGPTAGDQVGVIVKPSLGLSPAQVADVVAAAVSGGARWIKEDELLGDPDYCPLRVRLSRVVPHLVPGTRYFANVSGSAEGLMERARAAVGTGATGLMVNAAQGCDSVRALAAARLGVPILAHRAGAGLWCRGRRYGASPSVLAGLLRLAGADAVIVGAFGGKLFDTSDEVRAAVDALRSPLDGVAASAPVLGGGLGPSDVAGQVAQAGPGGLVVLLGSRAYSHRLGLEAAVAEAVASMTPQPDTLSTIDQTETGSDMGIEDGGWHDREPA
ncbi:MAG: RuBisCO large subunit C-terminal-like domain-containing protein [Acidimicrobiales bacterium]